MNIRTLFFHVPERRLLTYAVLLQTGAAATAQKTPGLAHLAEHVRFAQLDSALASHAWTDKDWTLFMLHGLPGEADALQQEVQRLLSPLLVPRRTFEVQQKVILSELVTRFEGGSGYFYRVWNQFVLQDAARRLPTIGHKEDVMARTLAELRQHDAMIWQKTDTTVLVFGDARTHAQQTRLQTRLTATLALSGLQTDEQSGEQPKSSPIDATSSPEDARDMASAKLGVNSTYLFQPSRMRAHQVGYGWRWDADQLAEYSPVKRHLILGLLEYIFTKGNEALAHQVLTQRLGVVYSPQSLTAIYPNEGYLGVMLTLDPSKLTFAVHELHAIFSVSRDKKWFVRALARARRDWLRHAVIKLANPNSVGWWFAQHQVLWGAWLESVSPSKPGSKASDRTLAKFTDWLEHALAAVTAEDASSVYARVVTTKGFRLLVMGERAPNEAPPHFP